jgi:hypothetical protein
VVSPVNASRRPSRDAAHHSGSGWLASPYPWGTFTSYSLPASWRTLRWVKTGRTQSEQMSSELPLKVDILDEVSMSQKCTNIDVFFGAGADDVPNVSANCS